MDKRAKSKRKNRNAELEFLRAENERLSNAEACYRQMFEGNPQPMWVYDVETLAFLAVNDIAIQQYGYSRDEFLEMTLRDVRPTEDIPHLLQSAVDLKGDTCVSGIWRHLWQDGSIRLVESTSHGIVFHGRNARIVLLKDITEQKRIEEELLRMKKIDSMNRLAGGIAHDFNNIMTAILGYVGLIRMGEPLPSESMTFLDHIQKAADHAARLTSQLLGFARSQSIDPSVIDLNVLLLGLQEMLRAILGDHIELVIITEAEYSKVNIDPGQLQEILIHLVTNAREAIPEGGKLLIETAQVTLGEMAGHRHPNVVPGDYVMLAFTDTGVGMTEDVKQHVFEPFFTTKQVGDGAGLGLATTHGIVEQNGGYIWVYSEPGQGSTFKIYLPIAVEDHHGDAVSVLQPQLRLATETVLLVEDEPMVLEIGSHALRSQGYVVLEASNGLKALELALEYEAKIDILVTDVIMPGMGGGDLAAELSSLRPGIRVLFTSGYTDNSLFHRQGLPIGMAFLQKPFSATALARKVRELLDAPALTPQPPLPQAGEGES